MSGKKVHLLVAWPLTGVPALSSWSDGWPESWERSGSGLVRQVGYLGNRSFRKAKVKTNDFQGTPQTFTPFANLLRASVVQLKSGAAVAIVHFEADATDDRFLNLNRPGLAAVSSRALSMLGLTLDPSETVFATTVVGVDEKSANTENGVLQTVMTGDVFPFEVTYSLVLAAIGVERVILEHATVATFKPGFLAINARRHLALLENWLTVPSSDSTRLIADVKDLRGSLSLDDRHNQVTAALRSYVNLANRLIGAFAGGLGLSIALLSQIFNISKIMMSVLDFTVLSVASATAISWVTWLVSKGK